jgi:hypothetical protein
VRRNREEAEDIDITREGRKKVDVTQRDHES